MAKKKDILPWTLNEEHEIYGKVVMVGCLAGESYRWFEKDGGISMIPLSTLELMNKTNENPPL